VTADKALKISRDLITGIPQSKWQAQQISGKMCWDAAMYVAVSAGGIRMMAGINAHQFNQMFPQPYSEVFDSQGVLTLPLGCFVGFVDATGAVLRHVMIYVGVGWAAGTNNGSMFPNNIGGWQIINITQFFGSNPQTLGGNRMIYRSINGWGL